jgi:hypothetical protein
MKTLYFLTFAFFLTIVTFSFGQSKIKSITDKSNIDFKTVDYIEIRNHSGLSDSVKTIRKHLSSEEAKSFVDKWNGSSSIGPCKYLVAYWIDVTLKDGTKRTFRTRGKSIKENNDQCFDLGDEKYHRCPTKLINKLLYSSFRGLLRLNSMS